MALLITLVYAPFSIPVKTGIENVALISDIGALTTCYIHYTTNPVLEIVLVSLGQDSKLSFQLLLLGA